MKSVPFFAEPKFLSPWSSSLLLLLYWIRRQQASRSSSRRRRSVGRSSGCWHTHAYAARILYTRTHVRYGRGKGKTEADRRTDVTDRELEGSFLAQKFIRAQDMEGKQLQNEVIKMRRRRRRGGGGGEEEEEEEEEEKGKEGNEEEGFFCCCSCLVTFLPCYLLYGWETEIALRTYYILWEFETKNRVTVRHSQSPTYLAAKLQLE